MREITVTYCDYCGKELKYSHSSIEYKEGSKVDLCDDYKEGEKSCKEKYRDEESKRVHS